MYTKSTFTLRSKRGNRKYLNTMERNAFFKAAMLFTNEQILFFHMIFWTGARISEVLSLTSDKIDFSNKVVVIRSLKKKTQYHFREIPLSDEFLKRLKEHISTISNQSNNNNPKLWSWSRSTGSRYIKAVMNRAKIDGIKANARGLRHSFAVHCIMLGIPLTSVQIWMGHVDISTTAI